MVGNVATAAGFMQFDAARLKQLGRGQQMRPGGIGFNAKGNNVGMFKQDKEIGEQAGSALLDERSLQVAGFRIRDDPKPPDLQVAHGYMVA
jgi:hypothetical protein